MAKMTLEKHAKLPASEAHGKNAKGFRAGGKTNLEMKKYGRNMAKVMNQRSPTRGRGG